MEDEYQVLNYLQEYENTTQRKISNRTGLSLGAVNLLLKKMVRKGLIKIEKLNARTVRYILPPRGIQEKSHLTYSYISKSYRQILKINKTLDYQLAEWGPELKSAPVIIFNPPDEIRGSADNKPVLVWRKEEEKSLDNHHQAVNIIKML